MGKTYNNTSYPVTCTLPPLLHRSPNRTIEIIKLIGSVEFTAWPNLRSSTVFQVKNSNYFFCFCLICQIREFWKKLAWPDPAGSYVFVMQITEVCTELKAQHECHNYDLRQG